MKTARELIEKETYARITVDSICKECNVSIGAFYHHFKSKQGVIIAGYEECDVFFREEVTKALKSTNPIDRIIEYIGCQMDYATSVGAGLVIEVYKAQITDGNDFFLDASRDLPRGLCAIIEEAQNAGAITMEQSASSLTSELLLISRGVIYNWCQNRGNYDLKSYCSQIITAHLKYYTIE